MNDHTDLVTTCNFRGKEYLVNLSVVKSHSGNIVIKVTHKKTLEEWTGSYDASYIENLTQKTGNYKRFDTFISMLKSGLLSTSQCVTLDLLTFEDLEMLRSRASNSRNFTASHASNILIPPHSNRRYLIVTYTVEFDRIHYPLAMEYCGPPDPRILQETILRLEKQVADLQDQLNNSNWEDITNQISLLQKKVVDVTTENIILKEQLKKITSIEKGKHSHKEVDMLLKSIYSLENKLQSESKNVEKLRQENCHLSFQLEQALKSEEVLRAQLNTLHFEPLSKYREQKLSRNVQTPSPIRNRSLQNFAEKPFSRRRSGERKVHSARSSFNRPIAHSSSEDSVFGGNYLGRLKPEYQFKSSPRAQASSPNFSDISHNSAITQCACLNCLQSKVVRKVNQSENIKKQNKGLGKAKLMKRIRSLEKLISGIVLN